MRDEGGAPPQPAELDRQTVNEQLDCPGVVDRHTVGRTEMAPSRSVAMIVEQGLHGAAGIRLNGCTGVVLARTTQRRVARYPNRFTQSLDGSWPSLTMRPDRNAATFAHTQRPNGREGSDPIATGEAR
jgi:hypothetical protein